MKEIYKILLQAIKLNANTFMSRLQVLPCTHSIREVLIAAAILLQQLPTIISKK